MGSCARIASRTPSEIWSAILSGWPSVTDSDVNRWRPMRPMNLSLTGGFLVRQTANGTRATRIGQSTTGMEFVVDPAQSCLENVRIDLGSREVRVPEHGLNRSQVCAPLQ